MFSIKMRTAVTVFGNFLSASALVEVAVDVSKVDGSMEWHVVYQVFGDGRRTVGVNRKVNVVAGDFL